MTKQILTRKQAVSLFKQLDKSVTEVDLFLHVDEKDKYFKLTNEEMEDKLKKYKNCNSDSIAGIVDF